MGKINIFTMTLLQKSYHQVNSFEKRYWYLEYTMNNIIHSFFIFCENTPKHEFLVKCRSLIFHPVNISMFTVFIVGNVLRLPGIIHFQVTVSWILQQFINRTPCLSMTHPVFGRKVPQEHSDHTPKGHTQQRLQGTLHNGQGHIS